MDYLFFFNDTATTEIYTLSLHDALPISVTQRAEHQHGPEQPPNNPYWGAHECRVAEVRGEHREVQQRPSGQELQADRKSTRLNSSHANISYAVFCLKKTKTLTLRLRELE